MLGWLTDPEQLCCYMWCWDIISTVIPCFTGICFLVVGHNRNKILIRPTEQSEASFAEGNNYIFNILQDLLSLLCSLGIRVMHRRRSSVTLHFWKAWRTLFFPWQPSKKAKWHRTREKVGFIRKESEVFGESLILLAVALKSSSLKY